MENTGISRTLHKNVTWEEFQVLRKKMPDTSAAEGLSMAEGNLIVKDENPDLNVPMLQKILHTFEDTLYEKGKVFVFPDIPERSSVAATRAYGSPRMGKIYALVDTSPQGTASQGILFAERMVLICDGRNIFHFPYDQITGVYPADRTAPEKKGAIVFRNKDGETHIPMDGLNKRILTEILNRTVKKLNP